VRGVPARRTLWSNAFTCDFGLAIMNACAASKFITKASSTRIPLMLLRSFAKGKLERVSNYCESVTDVCVHGVVVLRHPNPTVFETANLFCMFPCCCANLLSLSLWHISVHQLRRCVFLVEVAARSCQEFDLVLSVSRNCSWPSRFPLAFPSCWGIRLSLRFLSPAFCLRAC
jgi:hypothetical protein